MMCPKPKTETVVQKVADPTPVAVTNTDTQNEGAESTANKKERRKRGFSSTQVATDRTILGAINQATNNGKTTLG